MLCVTVQATEFLDQQHPSQIPMKHDLHRTSVRVVCPFRVRRYPYGPKSRTDYCAWSEHLARPRLSWARSADRDGQIPQCEVPHPQLVPGREPELVPDAHQGHLLPKSRFVSRFPEPSWTGWLAVPCPMGVYRDLLECNSEDLRVLEVCPKGSSPNVVSFFQSLARYSRPLTGSWNTMRSSASK
jgi:hypothetical protein